MQPVNGFTHLGSTLGAILGAILPLEFAGVRHRSLVFTF